LLLRTNVFLWKELYTPAVHAMNASQTYFDENDVKIQNGYQLFMTHSDWLPHPIVQQPLFFIEPELPDAPPY
jgi:hypothetical protein